MGVVGGLITCGTASVFTEAGVELCLEGSGLWWILGSSSSYSMRLFFRAGDGGARFIILDVGNSGLGRLDTRTCLGSAMGLPTEFVISAW